MTFIDFKVINSEILIPVPYSNSKINLRRKVKNNTLFLLGENSNYFNVEDENNLSDEFENYSIKKIQNSGHWVHAENPKDFITSVLDFLGPRV